MSYFEWISSWANVPFAIAGLALMGVVPSGAYLAKKLLLDAADSSGSVHLVQHRL